VLQFAAEQSAERLIDLQRLWRDMKKLKDILHTIVEAQPEAGTEEEHGVEMRRRQAEFTKRIVQILKLLDHGTIANDFATGHIQEIW
jgi:hypothetical protein